jgi:hypothetical protein
VRVIVKVRDWRVCIAGRDGKKGEGGEGLWLGGGEGVDERATERRVLERVSNGE